MTAPPRLSRDALPGWYIEDLHGGLGQALAMEEVLYRQGTGLQELVIFRNRELGRVLALDGVIQVTEADEYIYHEMLAHVPILAHGAVRRVLIIGGGDGGMLRRCLMHGGIERVVMVEIDRAVVDLCRQHLPAIGAGAFDDPRAELVIDDGCAYMARARAAFDVIIIDSTDPIGPGEVLFTGEFFADGARALKPGGIFVNQASVPFVQEQEFRRTIARMAPHFADVTAYAAAVPSYYGGLMTFGWGSQNPGYRRLPEAVLASRFAAAGLETAYYSPEVHVAAFALPRMIRKLVDESLAAAGRPT